MTCDLKELNEANEDNNGARSVLKSVNRACSDHIENKEGLNVQQRQQFEKAFFIIRELVAYMHDNIVIYNELSASYEQCITDIQELIENFGIKDKKK
jgi:Flp pilus assembly protein TadD